MSQLKKKKLHQCAKIIKKIVEINNVVNIKDYDDND